MDFRSFTKFMQMRTCGFRMREMDEKIPLSFGLETVKLNGEGFQILVKEGQKVNVGDMLLKVDIEEIKKKVPSIITPIVISNLKDNELVIIEKHG